jgi:FkbM family methyltransferase
MIFWILTWMVQIITGSNESTLFRLNPAARLGRITKPKPLNFSIYTHDPAECTWISGGILFWHEWEKVLMRSLMDGLNSLQNGQDPLLFVDVGANIGSYSMMALSLRIPGGIRVVSIEPLSYNIELLNASVSLAGAHARWTLYHRAVSEPKRLGSSICIRPEAVQGGRGKFSNQGNGVAQETLTACNNSYSAPSASFSLTSSSSPSASSLKRSRQAGIAERERAEVVQVTTLDTLLLPFAQPVAAMKIDIEGLEAAALRGASSLLSSPNAPCHIQFEQLRTSSLVEKSAASLLLVNYGYVCQRNFLKSSSKTGQKRGWRRVRFNESAIQTARMTGRLLILPGEYRCVSFMLQRCRPALKKLFVYLSRDQLSIPRSEPGQRVEAK